MARRSRELLRVASWLNVAFLLFLWSLETAVAERHWLAALATYMPQHPFGIPTAILILWSLFRRQLRMLGLNLTAGVLFLYALMGFCVPIQRAVAQTAPSARVLTLNVHHFSCGIGNVVSLIKRVDPDIVCLQEVNTCDWCSTLPSRFRRQLPGWNVVAFREIATLSKWRIAGSEVHRTIPSTGRAILETDIVGHRRYKVLNVHFSTASTPQSLSRRLRRLPQYLRHTTQVRSEQMTRVVEVAGDPGYPVIVAGDLNTPPRGRLYRRITTRFRDTYRSSGLGFGYTYRSGKPLMRIDYIFVRGTEARNVRVVGAGVSDHRAVVAEIQ